MERMASSKAACRQSRRVARGIGGPPQSPFGGMHGEEGLDLQLITNGINTTAVGSNRTPLVGGKTCQQASHSRVDRGREGVGQGHYMGGGGVAGVEGE